MPPSFTGLRASVARGLHWSDSHAMLLWAALAGVVGASATIGFREGISALQWLMVGRSASLVDIARSLEWPLRVAIPTLGGVVAGLLLAWARRTDTGAARPDYMEAIAIGDGRIPVRQSLLRSLSSMCTIASGGSIGREGSMIQLAALCSSLTGQWLRFDPARLRLLVACGAAAGITSAYNAPIAGAVFVTEIVLGSIAMHSFGPILVASVTANIMMRELAGYAPPYAMPVFPAVSGAEVILFIGLGILSGVLAPRLLQLLELARKLFGRSKLPLPVRLGVGGLLVGLLSLLMPEIWGNGYEVVNSLLHNPWPWTMLLAVLALKVAATAMTVGSGAIGGIFTPTLFFGAVVGCLFGQLAQALWPAATSAPFAYAIVGMGAFLAAATSAPLMAILMIFEMTLSYEVMLPLILCCVVSYFVARSVDEQSMYEITIRRNRAEQERLRLKAIRLGELIQPAVTVMPADASIASLMQVFVEHPVKYIYIVDAAQRYCGVVALKDISNDLLTGSGQPDKTAADFICQEIRPLTPDMSLGSALEHFMTHQGERLPVVRTLDDPVLLGAVHKTSLLDAYVRLSGGV
jgi:CIC family chloride channel protein